MSPLFCFYFALCQAWAIVAYVHPGTFPSVMTVMMWGLTGYIARKEAGK